MLDGQIVGAAPAGWTIHGAGDFNNDGKTDVIWQSTAGTIILWMMDGVTIASSSHFGLVSLTTTVQPMGN